MLAIIPSINPLCISNTPASKTETWAQGHIQVSAKKYGTESFSLREEAGGKDAEKENFRTRQGTILAKRPSSTTQNQVVKAVEARFLNTSKSWKRFAQESGTAVIILATPTFAKWLEDDEFIASCLGGLTRPILNAKKARKAAKVTLESGTIKNFELDVVCACVDGLSPNVKWIPYAVGHRASEGFSILQGRTADLLPDLWDSESSTITKSPTMTASLTFAKPTDSRKTSTETQIVLPLANTLFSNGRHSTLLVSKWRAWPDSFVKMRTLEKDSQTIHAFDILRNVPPPSIRVSATPITPARRIASGLGNIVKQIDFGEQGWGPASRELETNIDDYLAQTQREKSTIAVWALIVPKDLPKPPPRFNLLDDADQVKANWQSLLPNPEFIGYWLRRGAKFCRVLSGGGGWGVKQGLLSLDPQTTFAMIKEARFDFSNGSLEEQQNSALGTIAEVDSLIQFFVANTTTPEAPPPMHPVHGGVWRRTTVIGTVPSTIDDQRMDESPSSGKDKFIYLSGHFGAVSESGMFLRILPRKGAATSGDEIKKDPSLHTKIDLPYSYVYKDMIEERSAIRNTQARGHPAKKPALVDTPLLSEQRR
ncbi:hypothetical protein D0Z07_2574 [Hyphodiscus hymeniophilus]|uniref:Uncharacterized protein n=1 Tax=Hyphodiscus hymeniophilus TaxID=353542 RepID=A0A9P7AYX4_9HELO|nr:hypothetical protein D0Z07_2574 [Hyphodiscus hymeniophilus]